MLAVKRSKKTPVKFDQDSSCFIHQPTLALIYSVVFPVFEKREIYKLWLLSPNTFKLSYRVLTCGVAQNKTFHQVNAISRQPTRTEIFQDVEMSGSVCLWIVD